MSRKGACKTVGMSNDTSSKPLSTLIKINYDVGGIVTRKGDAESNDTSNTTAILN